ATSLPPPPGWTPPMVASVGKHPWHRGATPTPTAPSVERLRRSGRDAGLALSVSAEGVLAGQRATDDQLVDLGSALVGEDRLEVVRVPHQRVLEGDAGRAEDGAGLAGDGDRLADVVELAQADLLRSQ